MEIDSSSGCRVIEANDGAQGTAIPLVVLYPASGAERSERFGPYTVDLARDAPVVGEELPLVVISHGNGGTPWAYRDLAKYLSRAGFMVALPEHPGNSRNDNSLAGTAANLENRPRHISLVIDAILSDSVMRRHAAAERVGVIGHSIGGYTALTVAGGQAWAAPHECADGRAHPVQVTQDLRVGALVLLAPATFWFVPDSLREVRVPILMRTGEKDEITGASQAETVISGVYDSSLVEHKVIAGAGHFFAMSPFPKEMIRADFPPSQDPMGFRREDIQSVLYAEIVEFLQRLLLIPRII
jgi:predicted dienelactone hydrolase